MKTTILTTTILCLILQASATLVSQTVHKELTESIAARAEELLTPSERACILQQAESFGATVQSGRRMYDIVKYRDHVIEGLKGCGLDVSQRVKKGRRCGCKSGCHFCCALTGLGASDSCFRKHCPKTACLGKAFCKK